MTRALLALSLLWLAACPKKPVPIDSVQPDPGAGGGSVPAIDPGQPLHDRVNQAADLIENGGAAHLERAIEVLEPAASEDPTGRARFNLGLAYQKRGDLARAANQYQSVIALDPTNGDAWLGLGNVQELQGDPTGALGSFESGIAKDPENIGLHVALIGALRKTGRVDDAIEAAKAALRVDTRSLEVYNNFGLAYLDKGNIVLAKFIFQKAIQEIDGAEENPVLQTNLGWTFYLDDNVPLATEHLTTALKLDPNLVPALVYLSRVYMDDHNYGDTVPLLETAARLDPNNAGIQLTLGVAYRGVGRLDDAKRAYDKALALDPSDPAPHLNLGVLLGDYRKDYDGAVNEFSKYVAAGGPEKALAEGYIKDVRKEKEDAQKRVQADIERKAREEERKRKEELIKQPVPEEPAPEPEPEVP